VPQLTITRALPNPPGKDRTPSHQVTNQQLNNEWVEFANTSGGRRNLDGLALDHYTFNHACIKTGEDRATSFTGWLEYGQSMRVHTGTGTSVVEGSVIHVFLNRSNFIWNNRCGDTIVLRDGNNLVDWASYAGGPAEGAILQRVHGTNVLR
jgi:Lamin Tail Domain